ncbi:N-acetyltransferase [Rhodoferax sp. U11-2br]|uniref:GNAT family N-acetyltransferase n=1 Tax=Rhodoferax sp. U11-2br TaxID=2838878 RepID=UPI0020373D43|nr:GNAT family N-acetyltransferase [Rhodoferax sp. U11-2br]
MTREALLDYQAQAKQTTSQLFTLRSVTTAEDYALFGQLLKEYADKDLADAANSSIWKDLEALPERYGPPHGAALLAYAGDTLAGCGALTSTQHTGVAEVKRIYVREAFRRQGLARTLTQQLMAQAQDLGYHTAAISTWPENTQALALYQQLGFEPIAPFKVHPYAQLVFLGVPLSPATPKLPT